MPPLMLVDGASNSSKRCGAAKELLSCIVAHVFSSTWQVTSRRCLSLISGSSACSRIGFHLFKRVSVVNMLESLLVLQLAKLLLFTGFIYISTFSTNHA